MTGVASRGLKRLCTLPRTVFGSLRRHMTKPELAQEGMSHHAERGSSRARHQDQPADPPARPQTHEQASGRRAEPRPIPHHCPAAPLTQAAMEERCHKPRTLGGLGLIMQRKLTDAYLCPSPGRGASRAGNPRSLRATLHESVLSLSRFSANAGQRAQSVDGNAAEMLVKGRAAAQRPVRARM